MGFGQEHSGQKARKNAFNKWQIVCSAEHRQLHRKWGDENRGRREKDCSSRYPMTESGVYWRQEGPSWRLVRRIWLDLYEKVNYEQSEEWIEDEGHQRKRLHIPSFTHSTRIFALSFVERLLCNSNCSRYWRVTNMKTLPSQSLFSKAAFPNWGTTRELSSIENNLLSQFSQGCI